jgi:hypothetical protein
VQITSVQNNSLQSEGYVSFTTEHGSYYVGDSLIAGDPSPSTLGAELSGDSTLTLGASTDIRNHGGLSIAIKGFTGTGTYSLGAAPSIGNVQNSYDAIWETNASHLCKVHIDTIDHTNRKITGTFSFTANSVKGAVNDSLHVTHGVFYHVLFVELN